MNVRVLAKVRDANGVIDRRDWIVHPQSTFRVESGTLVIYGITLAGKIVGPCPQAAYAPGEWQHAEVIGSEHNPES